MTRYIQTLNDVENSKPLCKIRVKVVQQFVFIIIIIIILGVGVVVLYSSEVE
jgi:hypothetical protein